MLNLLPDEFHSNPSYVGSKKKWIFLVCQGAFILNRDYYLHDWFALDDMTAQSFKASRDFKLCIGQYKGVDCEVWNLKNVEIQLDNFMLVDLREVLISCMQRVKFFGGL